MPQLKAGGRLDQLFHTLFIALLIFRPPIAQPESIEEGI
jgi:hypothetical protein